MLALGFFFTLICLCCGFWFGITTVRELSALHDAAEYLGDQVGSSKRAALYGSSNT